MATVVAPVPQEMHAEDDPELEYTVHDDWYPCCSGGGYQKIKLYKDDIAFEQTYPRPLGSVFCFPFGTVPMDVACCSMCFTPLTFGCFFFNLYTFGCPFYWSLRGRKMVTRTPYRQLKNVQLNYKEGPPPCSCCSCCSNFSCFQSTYFIGGLYGYDAGRGMTPMFPMGLGKEKKLLAMTSEISKRMARAKAVE